MKMDVGAATITTRKPSFHTFYGANGPIFTLDAPQLGVYELECTGCNVLDTNFKVAEVWMEAYDGIEFINSEERLLCEDHRRVTDKDGQIYVRHLYRMKRMRVRVTKLNPRIEIQCPTQEFVIAFDFRFFRLRYNP